MRADKTVKVGVIGTSWWADRMFLPSLQSHPSAEISAICGRDRTNANKMAAKYAIPQLFTDYRELIKQGALDAVVIATPDDLHHTMTLAALEAGLHVLCEKPMALNTSDAHEMLQKAEEVGVKNMVMFTNRWHPHYKYLKQLLDAGYIGRPYHAHFSYLGDYARSDDYQWRFDGRRANGILGDLGAHMIDLAHWWVGDIVRVSAFLHNYVDRSGPNGDIAVHTNDYAALNVAFANGAGATIEVSAVAHQAERGLLGVYRLYGENGSLELTHTASGPTLRGARSDQTAFETLEPPAEWLAGLDLSQNLDAFFKQSAGARYFVDAIKNDLPIDADFRAGLRAQHVIDGAIRSQQTGSWQSVPAV